MSPSEDDLRAALRHGEHEAAKDLDVDGLVVAGRDRARQRRVRVLSGAAVVLVVAAAGTGGALLAQHGGARHQATQNPASSSVTGTATDTNAAAGPTGTVACPTTLPRVAPAGGRINTGTSAKLFPQPISELVVCSYLPGGSAAGSPHSVVLRGAQAAALRASLEDAAKVKPAVNCPMIVRANERLLAVIGVTSSGHRLPPVTTKINAVPCQVIVTNGATTRYDWSPPTTVAEVLARLAPSVLPAPGAGVTAHGSPIHS